MTIRKPLRDFSSSPAVTPDHRGGAVVTVVIIGSHDVDQLESYGTDK